MREPTAAIPLRWGSYRGRHLAGLALIVSGAVGLQGANPQVLALLLAGTVAHAAGWAIMPARGWRRMTVVVPSVAVIWLLLTGPQSVWALTVPYLAWLLVRHRPWKSYLTVVIVLAAGVLVPQFAREYSAMPVALGTMAVAITAAAWFARHIALSGSAPSNFTVEIE